MSGSETLLRELDIGSRRYAYLSLAAAETTGLGPVTQLPRSLKVLAENRLRHQPEEGVSALTPFFADGPRADQEITFFPGRIMLHDVAGIPLMADFTALRGVLARSGRDPARINPVIPVDLIVDHSVMVDAQGSADAVARNLDLEYRRNGSRYRFLRWIAEHFDNFRVVPPGAGICHQVNLEALSRCVGVSTLADGALLAHPDTMLGIDSHTPMVNCLGIVGWGTGGIEVGAAMLGEPVSMNVPRVVGCRLEGALRPGVTATDLVLTVVERLREYGVVGSFVEYFGRGLASLTLPDRGTLANMAPEYGATMGYFPIDEETLRYLEQTGREPAQVALVEAYARAQGLWHAADADQPEYAECVRLDLSQVEPSLAGPHRPQDRVPVAQVPASFESLMTADSPPADGVDTAASASALKDGDVAIAAITSCTNTSNPALMLAAGLLARRAVERGLQVPSWVKTSLSPGSRVVADYLASTGCQAALDRLGFQLTGFGCMTCMGNSGPLPEPVAQAIEERGVAAAAVLSGNRNFEGRVHPLVKANYIGSPPLVVAYALAGSVRRDLTRDPLGHNHDGNPVFLEDLWPSSAEIAELMADVNTPDRYRRHYASLFEPDARWLELETPPGSTYEWPDDDYMKEPPFFADVGPDLPERTDIRDARPLLMLGDSVTTDHISPVGIITQDSAAGQYLIAEGVPPREFNSFAARRVNHEVMLRGTFANVRIQNRMVPDRRGGWARHEPSGDIMPVHVVAERYRADGVETVVIAGSNYGQGSARDWAAKGTALLGVRAVIAEGFERIHRSNLIGMGVLPLQFADGHSVEGLALDGTERLSIEGIAEALVPGKAVGVRISRQDGSTERVPAVCRLDTRRELSYYLHGGILHYVLRQRLTDAA